MQNIEKIDDTSSQPDLSGALFSGIARAKSFFNVTIFFAMTEKKRERKADTAAQMILIVLWIDFI